MEQRADGDLKLISYSEEFKKARRYALAWSGLTVVASVGTELVVKNQSSLPGIFPLGLSYPKEFIMTSCWVVAAFMILGFYRSESIVRFINSEFARSKDISSIIDLVDQIRVKLKDFSEELDVVNASLGRIKRVAPQIISSSRSILINNNSKMTEELESDQDFAALISENANNMSNEQYLAKVLESKRNYFRKAYDHLSRMMQLFDEAGDRIVKDADSNLDNAMEEAARINNSYAEIIKLSDSISTFDSNISKTNRLWYITYDVGIVYAIFVICTLFVFNAMIMQ